VLTTHVRTMDRVLMVSATTRVTARQDIRVIIASWVRLLLLFYVTQLWHSRLSLCGKKVADRFHD